MQKRTALFLLLLLTVLLTACAAQRAPGATTAPAASDTPSVTETPEPVATSALTIYAQRSATPYAFPARVTRAPICDGSPPTNIIVHERARVTNDDPKPLNVREAASIRERIVEQLATLDIFMVIDGPRCANNFTWYRIRIGDVEGWVAEGDDETYYIAPYMP